MTEPKPNHEQESSSFTEPIRILREFIAAMNQWERQCWQEYCQIRAEGGDLTMYQENVLQGMRIIFNAYCTPRERPYGRYGSYQHPPEYDPETEQILDVVEESKNRVVITTQVGIGIRHTLRYVLLRKRGKWLIDNKMVSYSNDPWSRTTL